MVQNIDFMGRQPVPNYIKIGVEDDNAVEVLHISVPEIVPDQIVAVHIDYGAAGGYELVLPPDGLLMISRDMTQIPGPHCAWISIADADGAHVWHSETWTVDVVGLPDLEGSMEAANPGILEQAEQAIGQSILNEAKRAEGFAKIDLTSERVQGGVKVTATNARGETSSAVVRDGEGGSGENPIVTIDIESRADGTFWTLPIDPEDPSAKRPTSNDVINMVNAGKDVRLHFFDTVTNTGDQLYAYETTQNSVPIFRRNVITPERASRISIGVQWNGEVKFTDVPYNPPLMTTFATCSAPAAVLESDVCVWYVPKTQPKPTGDVGLMIDVFWENGRVGGLGYNVSLVWGEEGGTDNEVILSGTSVVDSLTNEHSIPAEGTVRYQLTDRNGRMAWKYVSGDLIPTQFSTDTDADITDKLVPGMQLGYLPGMEIYLQMDRGNTAPLMRIVPDEGAALPVYGNGTGVKTGIVPAGCILHLKNAGDHWQIVTTLTTVDAQLSETSENPVQNKAICKALDGKADVEGEWEQIVDAVTDKEVDEVVFDTEHDGNPYRFKKIKFFFEIQLNNQQLNGFFNNNRYTYTTGRKVTGLYYGLAVLDKTSDNFEYTITDAKTGKGLQTSYNPVLQAGGSITKARIVLLGNGIEPVPVGSKFVIWAVR